MRIKGCSVRVMDAFPRGRGHSYISRMAIVRGVHPAERLRGVKSIKLQGKTIVLGVTGSIAAVECVKLAHELIRHGAEVHAVFTRSATEIIHPNALQYATGNPVVTQITGSMVEPIDDVRVVTNRSTGGTGIELAKTAFEHGANVELWLGRHETPVPPWLPFQTFETTADLVSMAEKADADVCVVPAAVSDFTPAKKQSGKIPSREGLLSLDLQPTPKVLNRFRKGAKKALVGFKAEAGVSETELKARAMALVKEADVDFVVANDISKVKGDTTSITIFDRKGRSETFEGSKALAAERVWRAILHGVRG